MTYLGFLLTFVIPPLLIESIYFSRTQHTHKNLIKKAIGFLIFLALVYTTPWDNYLVKSGVWTYSDDRILGTIGYVPYEEYAFFILQSALTGLWFYFIQSRVPIKTEPSNNKVLNYLTTLKLVCLTVLGIYFLFFESTRYLGLILAWATPVVLLQWVIGGRYVLNNLKVYLLTVFPPTIYLWIIDAYAIHHDVWTISSSQTTGWKVLGLPVEEALFFYMTNIMLAQGLVLFVSMREKLKRFA